MLDVLKGAGIWGVFGVFFGIVAVAIIGPTEKGGVDFLILVSTLFWAVIGALRRRSK